MERITTLTVEDLPEVRQRIEGLRKALKRGPRKKAVEVAERFARGFHGHGWDPGEYGVNVSVFELADTMPPILRELAADVLRKAVFFWLVPSGATLKRLGESTDVFLGVAKRGKKPNPAIVERNDKMRQAMAEGVDNDALAYRFGVSVDTARKQRQLYEEDKRKLSQP